MSHAFKKIPKFAADVTEALLHICLFGIPDAEAPQNLPLTWLPSWIHIQP